MNEREIKNILEQYKDNEQLIQNIEERIDRLEARIMSVTTPPLSPLPGGGIKIGIDDYIIEKEKLKEKINNLTVKNTICFATKERQLSAIDLAKEVDCMVVIGGKHSSNTQKLVTICSKVVPTFSIETKEELKKEIFENFKVAGVTAGASTPDWIIDEVIEYLKEI